MSSPDLATVNFAPAEVLLRLRRRGATVLQLPGRSPFAYLLGPEANAFIFGHDELFSAREAFASLIPVDGPTALIVSDGEDHRRRRALVRPALHHRQIEDYVSSMAASADEVLDRVRPGEELDAYALFRSAIRRSTVRALFGEQMGQHAQELGFHLQPLLDLIDRPPQAVTVHTRLRTPTYRRAVAARERLDAFVDARVAQVRADPGAAETAVLPTLVHGRDETGGGLSDQEVRDQVVSLIAAGYETTSGAMAWLLYGLAGRPELLADVRAEVLDVSGEAPPSAADLRDMPLLAACVSETLRLYPPAAVSARYAVQGFELAGRRVRPGTLIAYSPYVTHRDPDVYAQPRAFRPERWTDGAKRPPSEYLPFGGGVHRCIGSTMATTELAVLLARLLARGSYAVPVQRVRATSYPAMRPSGGLRAVLHQM